MEDLIQYFGEQYFCCRILCCRIHWLVHHWVIYWIILWRSKIDCGLGTILWYSILFCIILLLILWCTILLCSTIDGGPGQGDYLLCRGRNGFSGGWSLRRSLTITYTRFTQLCVYIDVYQSVTNIFEYSNIRIYWSRIYIRTFVCINFSFTNIFEHSFVSNLFVRIYSDIRWWVC